MASFTLFSHASDTIDVNVAGANEGSIVRIQGYLASDPSWEVFGVEVIYTGFLITETFHGLTPNTTYSVEVYVDDNQIGTKTITTPSAKPPSFQCNYITSDSVTVIVSDVVYGDDVDIAIYLASDSVNPEIQFTVNADSWSVSRIIYGLKSGTSYNVQVHVNGNLIGTENITTTGSSVTPPTPPTPPPSASPSFSCGSNSYDSVSINVTGITSDDVVQFTVYLADGANTILFQFAEESTGSSLYKRIPGLDSETSYIIEVHVNDNSIGTKTVTTQAAPSFDCVSNTYDTIMVTVVHVLVGSSIRFVGFLASDPSSTLFTTTVKAGSASVSRTFNKLRELTEYIVDVYVDDVWIGRQTVQTKKKPNIINGRIVKLPILRPDYPLFSWDDWPDSRDALIAEGEAKYFEKEAWNDIIDTLATALKDSEITWNNVYTSADEAKITEEYGDLYAKAFNSIRHNINNTISLPWAWSVNPNFHGYVGREDFKGYDQYGEDGADDVYSTYFLELARRLNLFIEILRGTANTPNAAFGSNIISSLNCSYGGYGLAINGMSTGESQTRFEAYMYSRRSAFVLPKHQLIPVSFDTLLLKGYGARAILRKTKACVQHRVSGYAKMMAEHGIRYRGISSFSASSISQHAIGTTGLGKTMSDGSSTVQSITALRSSVSGKGVSDSFVTGDTGEPLGVIAGDKGVSDSFVISTQVEALKVAGSDSAVTKKAAAINESDAACIKAARASSTSHKLTFGNVWLLPVWVEDGSLLIRQAYETTQNNNSLEIV